MLADLEHRLRNKWRARQVARLQALDPRLGRWGLSIAPIGSYVAWCNICGWHGDSFQGPTWCESAGCPACGSVARDRFVRHCWTSRTSYKAGHRVLETSPRIGGPYRDQMKLCVDYLASDFDERQHKADVHLDLQSIEMDDKSLDAIVTAHVLEHVPDYPLALREMFRVLRPGGHLFLQVPLLQGATAPPTKPEFHEDDTPVFWRFGWDLRDACAAAGFDTAVLVTESLRQRAGGSQAWADQDPAADFDPRSIAAHLPDRDALTSVATVRESRRMGFEPEFMYVVFDCTRPPA